MANGALPFSLATSSFRVKHSPLKAVVTAGSGDTHILNMFVPQNSEIVNVNGEVAAYVYTGTQTFYYEAGTRGSVMQIVPTSANIDIAITTSIDGINWDTPSGWSDIAGATASTTVRLKGLAPGEHVKIVITKNSGTSYYVNVLPGGDN